MRRCTYCFRFQPGHPTFCAHCGRSYGVRLCTRGHINPRGATFCAECGSADLSTPAPEPTLLFRLSGLAVSVLVGVAFGLAALAIAAAAVSTLDWDAVSGPLIALLVMVGVVYWTTTLLPGPIKKVGRAAGRAIGRRAGRSRREP
jgi:hypothetical protein